MAKEITEKDFEIAINLIGHGAHDNPLTVWLIDKDEAVKHCFQLAQRMCAERDEKILRLQKIQEESASEYITLRRHCDELQKTNKYQAESWESVDKELKRLQSTNSDAALKVGRFELSDATSEHFNGKPTIWLKTNEGEGTTIDLEKLFDREM